MNIDKLYTNEEVPHCKLCGAPRQPNAHEEDCPGRVLEGLSYEIKVTGDNCTRGCCGYTNTSVTGDSLASIAEEAVLAGSAAVRPSFEARAIFEMGEPTALIEEARQRIEMRQKEEKAKLLAKKEALKQAAARAAAYAQLAVDKPDLSEEGYARRLAQLVALYGLEYADGGTRG